MRHHRTFLLRALLLAVFLSGPVLAGPFEDGVTAYERGDYATAMRLWQPLADQGNAGAQYSLGVIYDKGQGVPQENSEAVRWFRKAADQGRADAQSNLGLMYATGRGVPQDYVQAHKWFSLAAAGFNTLDTKRRNQAVKNQDIVAGKMSPAQIAEAQRLAREWKPK